MGGMKKEIKDKWLEALRSGEYTQTTGVLHRVEPDEYGEDLPGYCCLGVLCEIGGVRKGDQGDGTQWYGRPGTNEFPSTFRLKRLGLTFDQANNLATMNDNGHDFKGIADYIEENL